MELRSRLHLMTDDEYSSRQRAVYERIAAGPRKGVRGPLRLLLHSPDLAEQVQALGEVVRWKTRFPPRLVELAILITARHLECDYVWKFHSNIVERDALMSAEELAAVKDEGTPVSADAEFSLVQRFCIELLSTRRVKYETLDEMISRFGDAGVVEVTTIVGYYHMGSMLCNVAELDAAS